MSINLHEICGSLQCGSYKMVSRNRIHNAVTYFICVFLMAIEHRDRLLTTCLKS